MVDVSAMSEALSLIAQEPWEIQEASYTLLVKLIQNAIQNPDVPKFRRISRESSALQSKLLSVPGGSAALSAAGFKEEADAYVLLGDVSVALLGTMLQVVQQHAEARKLEYLRAERDAKIAKAKSEEAELAKFGGFARGIHKLGSASQPGCESSATYAIPSPVTSIFAMDDPRTLEGTKEQLGVVAFYYPGHDTPWDKACRSGFLGNFFLQPKGEEIQLAPPNYPDKTFSFTNAEAAFQALKLWKYVDEFENVDGEGAFKLKKKYMSQSDMTYSGYKSNWCGMLQVLRQKYRPGTACAEALVATGDSFLLEHNKVEGRDKIWSDNFVGNGSNWLGLQLMLVRDELNATEDTTSWRSYLESILDLHTGRPLNDSGKPSWQSIVKSARDVVAEKRM